MNFNVLNAIENSNINPFVTGMKKPVVSQRMHISVHLKIVPSQVINYMQLTST